MISGGFRNFLSGNRTSWSLPPIVVPACRRAIKGYRLAVNPEELTRSLIPLSRTPLVGIGDRQRNFRRIPHFEDRRLGVLPKFGHTFIGAEVIYLPTIDGGKFQISPLVMERTSSIPDVDQ
jgi:hypothetical protein